MMNEIGSVGALVAGRRSRGRVTTLAAATAGEHEEPSGVVVARGSTWTGERRALAALLYEGYAQKAAALHIPRETALAALAGALDLNRCFVAVRNGTLVGVVGLVENDGRALRFSLALIRRHFGPLRSLAYFLVLGARTWGQIAARELVFEALAVSPKYRRQGIGRSLVTRVEEYARAKGYSSVGLDVTDSNRAAIRLYRRMGYAIVKTRRYGLATRRAGFGGHHRMRKWLPGAPWLATP
jgi:ribosomal protein S18 acetylase RimI-like enzyme